ncbi:uncharacterized protein LOC117587809 isoform X2 [Drosophila guanche]|uniref:uncharacterized protein LOC117587809 isoform X2 n=1 Tax=Drosophila guanche TaxID=7266 RepID=UPI001471CFE4|nr:uncharacterized protein LOC117587809 isoform X2 [Drosophila guanche]
MLQPQDEEQKDKCSTVVVMAEITSEDPLEDGFQDGAKQTPDSSMSNYVDEIQSSQEQITTRFTELLNFFESYAKIIDVELKQPVVVSNQLEHHDEITSVIVEDHTIKTATSEVSIQTSLSLLKQQQNASKVVEQGVSVYTTEKPSQALQHTIHIEVENVPSETEMQRTPLRQRFCKIVVNALEVLIGCMYMVGENITYVMLLSVLCIWCFYR